MFPPAILFGIALTIVVLIIFYFLVKNILAVGVFSFLYVVVSAFSVMLAIIASRILWPSYISQNAAISSIVGMSLVTIVFLWINSVLGGETTPISSNISELRIERLPSGGLYQVIEEGFNSIEAEDYDGAIRSFNLALDFSEDKQLDLKLRTELAFAYQMSGNVLGAIGQLKRALELAGDLNDNSYSDIENSLNKIRISY